MNLAEHLIEARTRAGISQHELAQKAGLNRRQTVAKAEAGAGDLFSFMALLDALGLRLTGLPEGDSLGDRLRAKRVQAGLTQRDLAALAGVALPTLVGLEKRSAGRMTSLVSVAVALRVELGVKGGRHWFKAGGTDEWNTPEWVCQLLTEVFGRFDLDPCAGIGSHVQADRSLFLNGLDHEWRGRVFVNPPYSECEAWVRRSAKAFTSGEAELVVLLVPARTSTGYHHDAIAGVADVLFLRGRLKFGTSAIKAPFPSLLAIYGGSPEQVAELVRRIPCQHVPALRVAA